MELSGKENLKVSFQGGICGGLHFQVPLWRGQGGFFFKNLLLGGIRGGCNSRFPSLEGLGVGS